MNSGIYALSRYWNVHVHFFTSPVTEFSAIGLVLDKTKNWWWKHIQEYMQDGSTCIRNRFIRGRLNQRSRAGHNKHIQKPHLQICKDEVGMWFAEPRSPWYCCKPLMWGRRKMLKLPNLRTPLELIRVITEADYSYKSRSVTTKGMTAPRSLKPIHWNETVTSRMQQMVRSSSNH